MSGSTYDVLNLDRERVPDEMLEADEFQCVACGVLAREHPMDGRGECPDCVEADHG